MARRNQKQPKNWDKLKNELEFKNIRKDLEDYRKAISEEKPKFRIVQSKMNNKKERNEYFRNYFKLHES